MTYKSVYKNTGMTPRKMHRVEDHYAIHTFKSEWDDAKDFFVGALIVFAFIGFFLLLGYGFMAWLDGIK